MELCDQCTNTLELWVDKKIIWTMLMLNWNVCGGVLVKAEMCCVLDIDRSHQEALSRCVISLLEKPGDTPFQPPTSWKKFKMKKKTLKKRLSLSNAGWPPSSPPIERVDPPEKTFLSQRLLVKTKLNLFGKNKTKLLVKKISPGIQLSFSLWRVTFQIKPLKASNFLFRKVVLVYKSMWAIFIFHKQGAFEKTGRSWLPFQNNHLDAQFRATVNKLQAFLGGPNFLKRCLRVIFFFCPHI